MTISLSPTTKNGEGIIIEKTDFLKKPVFFSGTGQNRTAVQNGY